MKRKEVAILGNSTKEMNVKGLSSKTLFKLLEIKQKLSKEIESYAEYQKVLVSETRPDGYAEGDKIPESLNSEWINKMNIILEEYFNEEAFNIDQVIPKDEFIKFVSANEDSITLEQLSCINEFLVKDE